MTQDQTPVAEAPTGKLAAAQGFIAEARTEMEKVSWPEKDQLITSTRAVLIGAVVLGLVIGLVDKLLQLVLVDGVALLTR
jgi:preprotein translocase SecE subunit